MAAITPYLLYEDCASALEWLSNAFGFKETLRYTEPDGTVSHAEMELEGATIMMGDPGAHYRNPKRLGDASVTLYVLVDDVDAHFARAKAAGATITSEPEDTPYGDRNYRAEDPEGHRWMIAQRVRDVAPEEWGATTA